jgi:hypothetical protein
LSNIKGSCTWDQDKLKKNAAVIERNANFSFIFVQHSGNILCLPCYKPRFLHFMIAKVPVFSNPFRKSSMRMCICFPITCLSPSGNGLENTAGRFDISYGSGPVFTGYQKIKARL